jgi:carbamoyltransferase
MLTAGLKLTHDAAVAVFDENRLLFSIEAEKLDNNPRYSKFHEWQDIWDVLASEGLNRTDIERWSIDGWKQGLIDHFEEPLKVSGYFEWDRTRPQFYSGTSYELGRFYSHTHVAGHIWGSVMMSGFERSLTKPIYCLVWDGGMPPWLYRVEPDVYFPVANAHWLNSIIYGIASYYFGPYALEDIRERKTLPDPSERLMGRYETPGKLMSWMAKSEGIDFEFQNIIDTAYEHVLAQHPRSLSQGYYQEGTIEHALCRMLLRCSRARGLSEATAFHNLHEWLGRKLVALVSTISPDAPLIFTGGSALNIKWNSDLRASRPGPMFVPPIANDTGSAIGTAAASMRIEFDHIDWSPFAGPRLIDNGMPAGWVKSAALPARVLADGEVVCRLYGRAEIGPRALGHRSLLAAPRSEATKARLNTIKGRELWRPVAPIATPDAADAYFAPGGYDPYMLFDHGVRIDAPLDAIRHLDGSARLQTITMEDDTRMYQLLLDFGRLAGAPTVLCNTSANLNGSGFFPTGRDAAEWAGEHGVRFILIDDTMWENKL